MFSTRLLKPRITFRCLDSAKSRFCRIGKYITACRARYYAKCYHKIAGSDKGNFILLCGCIYGYTVHTIVAREKNA